MHAKKIANMMDLAAKNGAPIIGLNDSGGARFRKGSYPLDGYGHIFYRNSIYSGVVPQISVIHGPLCGRCGVFSGHHRFCLYGGKNESDVHYRSESD